MILQRSWFDDSRIEMSRELEKEIFSVVGQLSSTENITAYDAVRLQERLTFLNTLRGLLTHEKLSTWVIRRLRVSQVPLGANEMKQYSDDIIFKLGGTIPSDNDTVNLRRSFMLYNFSRLEISDG